MPATLGSLLLSSTDPQRLSDFYAAALGVEPSTTPGGGYRVLNVGGFYILVDSRDDVADKAAEPGRIILNFDVEDATATAARFEAAGATWLAPLEDRDGSFFATAIDPDGNYVQLIQLSEAEKSNM